MADSKLESFKIADTRKPASASAPRKIAKGGDTTAAESEAHSLGFRRIEGILEKEDPATVRSSLDRLHSQLAEVEKKGRSNKDKAAAKKAIVAVTRTSELMDYLFQTKASMQTNPGK